VEDEDRVAAGERLGPGHAPALLVAAAVPDDHAARARPAFETVVGHAVVLDSDGQALARGIQRRAPGYGPRAHHPVDLEAEVEVARRRRVLLDDEDPGRHAALGERLVALGADLRDVGPAPGRDQRGDRRPLTLHVGLPAPVRALADPTHDLEFAGAVERRPGLHSPGDEDPRGPPHAGATPSSARSAV